MPRMGPSVRCFFKLTLQTRASLGSWLNSILSFFRGSMARFFLPPDLTRMFCPKPSGKRMGEGEETRFKILHLFTDSSQCLGTKSVWRPECSHPYQDPGKDRKKSQGKRASLWHPDSLDTEHNRDACWLWVRGVPNRDLTSLFLHYQVKAPSPGSCLDST